MSEKNFQVLYLKEAHFYHGGTMKENTIPLFYQQLSHFNNCVQVHRQTYMFTGLVKFLVISNT